MAQFYMFVRYIYVPVYVLLLKNAQLVDYVAPLCTGGSNEDIGELT